MSRDSRIGLQMYTMRHHMANREEYRETLRRVAEIGYEVIQTTLPSFYTAEEYQAEMEEFAQEHGIQYDTLREIMTEYVFSGNISDEAIRQHFRDYHFGLLKITKLTEETRAFAFETYKKYKAEGD